MDLDIFMVVTIVVTAMLVVGAFAAYVVELRRSGSAPWTEWYNDRVVPMYRGRGRPVT